VFDADGTPAAPTSVTLSIASGPAGATLGGTTTVTTSAGIATFSDISLPVQGTYTLAAAATGRQGATSNAFHVDAGPVAAFAVTGVDSPTTAGHAQHVMVAAHDSFGNVVQDYLGTVHFSSTDPMAVLHGDYTFTHADRGTHNFAVTLDTAGNQSVTATDTVSPSVTGTQAGIVVQPAAATTLALSGFPAQTNRAAIHNITVTAKDAYGNTVTSYGRTVFFSSSDARAILPSAAKLTNGTGTFPVALRIRGPETIVVTDGAISGSQTVTVV
jgi:hypothetical protein